MSSDDNLARRVHLTYADYLDFPEDGQRYEIIDGRVYVTPAPIPDHQRVSRCFQFALMQWARRHPPAEVFSAPIDLILSDDTIVQPDLLVSRDRSKVTQRAIEAAPDLVIEILSPSTRGRDRGLKRERYARSGVKEYWVADPQQRTIEQYVLRSGELTPLAPVQEDSTLSSHALEDLALSVQEIFQDLD